jgi:hypothetical protein
VDGAVVVSILEWGLNQAHICVKLWRDSRLKPIPPSPSLGFPVKPNESVEAAGISEEYSSSFTRNLLVPDFGLGPSGMGASLNPPPSLVGERERLAEREELSFDASKCRGREEVPDVFKLNRGLDCGIDRSSPPMLRDCQFRE